MGWECLNSGQVKARKDHSCCLCNLLIKAGEIYVRRVGAGDGELVNMCMHVECEAYTKDWDENDWENYDPDEFRSDLKAGRAGQTFTCNRTCPKCYSIYNVAYSATCPKCKEK